jgi:hypothetical protein
MLREAFRLLSPDGMLLLDLPDREYALNNFSPESSHAADDDTHVHRRRHVKDDVVYGRETVVSQTRGLIREAAYCTHLYSPERIRDMLASVGFSSADIRKDFVSHEKRADYGLMTNRMIVVARKE